MKQILKLKRNQKSWRKRDNHRIIIYDIRRHRKKWYDIISRDGLLPKASLKKKSWTCVKWLQYIKIINKTNIQRTPLPYFQTQFLEEYRIVYVTVAECIYEEFIIQ